MAVTCDVASSSNIWRITLTITVSGGVGEETFNQTGRILQAAIIPPNGATYDFEIGDEDGYGIGGEPNLSGKVTLGIDKICFKVNTIYFTNATDGDYKVRLLISPR